jgi:steroid 5-alpha reductase family enzyme
VYFQEFISSIFGGKTMDTATTRNELAIFGYEFLRWGSKLFITGLVLGLIPLVHYMVGGVGHEVGEEFFRVITLWFGCPAEKMLQIVQVGGLSMIIIGLCFLHLSRTLDRAVTNSERLGLKLCVAGLVAEVLSGAGLYLLFDYTLYPNFFFEPIIVGKNLWLGAQLVSFSIYLAGVVLVLGGVKQSVNALLQPS